MDTALYQKLKLGTFKSIVWWQSAKEESPWESLRLKRDWTETPADLIICYVYTLEEMKTSIMTIVNEQRLQDGGIIYFLYPKKANRLGHVPIGRDEIFPYLDVEEATGFVPHTDLKFNRMVSFDAHYTLVALKHIAHQAYKPAKVSQRVDDYLEDVPRIVDYLSFDSKVQTFFLALTPGYQKEWARYVYSARTDDTRTKRLGEIVHILSQGFKTKAHYRTYQQKNATK